MNSFCAILEEAATEVPDKPLFVFPESRWRRAESLTYRELASHCGAAARTIAEHADPGARALLLFPTGAAFWEAFMGCLAARVATVPLNIPNLNRSNEHLQEVCKDCTPSVLITNQKTADVLSSQADKHPNLSQLPVITPELWRSDRCEFAFESPHGSDIALLQYTSGSTARPKGVQVSHGNLLANLEMIRDRMGIRLFEDCGVTWLPHYHDMGLIGSYLATLFTKNTSWCLQPEEFVLQPERWLQLISEQRASVCGGPDFGYRLCVEKIQEEQLVGIDLSSWRVAYIGSERIRPETIQRFTEKFSRYGFLENAFFPCYGLSEATLLVTGGPAEALPVLRHISSSALMENRIEPPAAAGDCTSLVGSGQTFEGSKVVILEPGTNSILADDQIGEVLLSGPAVTGGYFNREVLNDQVFRDLLIDGRRVKFLQTGDLGFLSSGELFITGRTKELIIVRGRNLYPDDVEQRIGDTHEALAPGKAVAFSADLNGQESLIIAAELRRSAVKMASPETVVAAIRVRVVEVFGVSPAEILLLRPASIPKTSSGKLKRVAVRDSYVDGSIASAYRESP